MHSINIILSLLFFFLQHIFNDSHLSDEIDWCHLSNIVTAYDVYCLQTYSKQRSTIVLDRTPPLSNEQPATLTSSIVLAFSTFIKSLPAYYSLPRSARNHLSKTNIRPLIFPNIHELNQSCFSEPWQVNRKTNTFIFK